MGKKSNNRRGSYNSREERYAKKHKNWENLDFGSIRERSDVKEFMRYQAAKERKNKKVILNPRSYNQQTYIDALENPTRHIIFGIGPAGTGKTMLATQFAIKCLQEEKIERIILSRPAVSVDEEHGFLPGSLQRKMEPWLLPITDVFEEYYSPKEVSQMINENIIHIAPMAYMRGRTFKNAIVLCDEMQNSTPSQMKSALTRIGDSAKVIITGDLRQHDRGYDNNGLKDFLDKFETNPSDSIEIVKFDEKDIVRHPVIEDVLRIYGED